jgi:hypothetical protein
MSQGSLPDTKNSDKNGFPKIDYRSLSQRKIDRARTNKANALFSATVVAIVVGIACIFIWS